MKQDNLGTGRAGLSSLVKPNHKGVIIMLHGYNNAGSIDAADAEPVSVFEDGKVTTQLWPHTRYLYHRFIAEAGGNPDDYLFLFVRWTGDWGDNTLTKAGFFGHDYGLAHHAGAFPLTKLMEDLIEAYDEHDVVENRGNNQIDRPFMFMIQGNSLGGRAMTSTVRGMQNIYQLEQLGNRIGNKEEEDAPDAFPNQPEIRIFFAHSALPSADLAPDRLGLRRQDEQDNDVFREGDQNNEKVMAWPNSPLQEEYRGLKLHNNHALCFYSPYDKPGYIFSHRFTAASSDARGEMLGRVGPDPSYDPNAEHTLAAVCAVHSASGTDFQDLWHVQLMGWQVPGQLFGSRATYTHNDFGNIGIWRGLRKSTALANINSSARMSLIQEGHIVPIWSRVGRYVVTGDHE